MNLNHLKNDHVIDFVFYTRAWQREVGLSFTSFFEYWMWNVNDLITSRNPDWYNSNEIKIVMYASKLLHGFLNCILYGP